MALLDHYKMEDMPKVLDHIENLMNAGLDGLKAAETANQDLKKNAVFQIEHSFNELFALHEKKKESEQIASVEYAQRHWF